MKNITAKILVFKSYITIASDDVINKCVITINFMYQWWFTCNIVDCKYH